MSEHYGPTALAHVLPLRIMLVDDNVTFVSTIRRVLDLLPGAKVVAKSHDGEDALVQAERLRPDLVLLDIDMPGMNGLDVARTLYTWSQPPHIVFLSMHDGAPYREAARVFGASFVGKADFVSELLPMIELLILRKAATEDGL